MSHLIRRFIAVVALVGCIAHAAAQTDGSSSQPASISSVSLAPGKIARLGTINVYVTFTSPVSFNSTPVMHITIGGVAHSAMYSGSRSDGAVIFAYRPDLGDNGVVALQSPIDPRDGTVTGANGLPADLNFTPPDTSQTIVDTTPPTKPVITSYDATSSTPSFHGTADPGITVRVLGRYSGTAPEAIAAADGSWNTTWTGEPLQPGTYSFSAWVDDDVGNSNNSDFVTVTVPPNGPPVIAQHADMDLTWHFYHHDYPDTIHLTATNAPTKFEATGMPPGVSFYSHGAPDTFGEFDWTYGTLTGGKYTVSVTATNALGTSAPMVFQWTIHPGMNDFLSADKYYYNAGELITLTAKFSAPVVVTGTPYIQLWGTKKAMYASGSGTSTLKFTYQLAPDDPAGSGLYYDTITANGGSITTPDGVSASLVDSYWGLNGPTGFTIAAPGAPIVTDVTINGQVGVPIAPVQLQATNSPTSFTLYDSAPGIQVSSSGLITGTPTQVPDRRVLRFYATNSVGQSAPGYITLNITAASAQPVFASTPDMDSAYFEFGNISQDSSARIFVANSPTTITATGLPSGVSFVQINSEARFAWSPEDLTGGEFPVTLTATNAAGTTTATFRWIVHPGVVGYITPDNASYGVGDTITLTAQFSSNIVVTGTPYIPLWSDKRATYASGSGTQTLTFKYTVMADDASRTNVRVTGITLGSGTIATPGGTSAAKLGIQEVIGTSYPTFNVTTPTPPPPPPPPPITDPAKTNQTITFSSPVSAIIVGQPIQLGATSSAGLPITYSVVSGDATISGNVLTPTSTANLVVRASSAGNDTVNPAVVDVAFGTPQKAAQNISVATTGGIVPAEKTIALSASATSGLPITYSVVSGPATINGDTLTFTGTGTVVVRAAQPGNGTYAATDTTLTFTANPVDRLINISSMLHVGPDDGHVSIAGFVVTGSSPKPILIRAVGPSLAPFGVNDGVATPTLTLRNNAGAVVATNSGWNNDAQIGATSDAVGAFRLASGSKDAAIVTTLAPGPYTAQVSSSNTGSVLIEVYDASANAAVPTKQLINISSRGAVDAGSSIIGGFVVNGAQPKRVLIRAIGPGLAAFGVSSVLADPVVKVYDANGVVIAQNDNWETAQTVATMPAPAGAAEITAADTAAGAFALNTGSKDGAVVLTLAPGSYSAVVTGANGSTGAALVEIYEVPGTP